MQLDLGGSEDAEGGEPKWTKRRRGKALRNAIFAVKATRHGMQGRLLHFQEHPYECQTNYGGLAAMRCNLNVQDLRRVLSEKWWLEPGERMPHLGSRDEWGWMQCYEWNGTDFEPRHQGEALDPEEKPVQWDPAWAHEDWRELLLNPPRWGRRLWMPDEIP